MTAWTIKPEQNGSWSVLRDGEIVADRLGTPGAARHEMKRLVQFEIIDAAELTGIGITFERETGIEGKQAPGL